MFCFFVVVFWGEGGGVGVFFSEGRFDCFLNFLHYVFIVGLLLFVAFCLFVCEGFCFVFVLFLGFFIGVSLCGFF